MLFTCRTLLEFIADMEVAVFLTDTKTRFAVRAGFEILGEAARNIPAPLRQAHPDVPWTTLVAARNRISHGYFAVDDAILFATIEEDLKPLLSRLESLARAHGIAV